MKGADWASLKAAEKPKTVTEIISQNYCTVQSEAKTTVTLSPVQEAQLISSNRDKKSLKWCLLEAVETWMDMDFIVKLTQQNFLA